MVHYYIGDEPRGELQLAPSSVEDAGEYPEAVAEWRTPSGVLVSLAATTAPDVDGDGAIVTVQLAGLELIEAGVHQLQVTLVDSTLGAERMRAARPIRVPVEDPTSPWYLLDAARADWPGAPADDARLHDLLDVARGQVLAFAPPLDELGTVPDPLRQAQLMQARNIWNAQQIDPGATSFGGDGFQVRVYPLDWSVKQMIRPQSGRPVVG